MRVRGEPPVTDRGATVHAEPARSYSSAWLLAAILVAGFLVDLAFGGAIAHLPGWVIAFVLVVGIDLLVVRAARSVRSLRVTVDEVRVGDEAIGRAEIVGPAPDTAAGSPVLGWPTGLPRGMRGVGLRLFDGQDVVIPTRHPQRLRSALGLAASHPDAAEVRAAEPPDLAELAEIDERADTVFRIAGYDLPDIPFDDAGTRAAQAIFVAGRPPVGFVRVDEVDGLAHVEELAVLPGSMRRGIGTRLLERACEWAGTRGYPAITLITFADVAWNAPFYAARGFTESADLTPGLERLRDGERTAGLDAVGRRIVMRRALGPAARPPLAGTA